MKVLLDTHIAIWASLNDPRLSAKARSMIAEPSNEIYVSAASVWEISIKAGLGKLDMVNGGQAAAVFRLCGYKLLDVTAAHAGAVDNLPAFANHKDPFDRMLVAQALQEAMVLLTDDARLPQYHPILIVAA